MYKFRKFKGKREIVLSAMQMQEWNPGLTEDQFTFVGDLEQDLISFAEIYMEKVTPRVVKVSLGLRTPELYPYTAEGILKVPQTFKKVLIHYFNEMKEKIVGTEYESK